MRAAGGAPQQKRTVFSPLTTRVPRELKQQVVVLAREHYSSTAAEVRRALAEHVERERARAGTPGGAVEASAAARTEGAR